jgi:hypothetical protein
MARSNGDNNRYYHPFFELGNALYLDIVIGRRIGLLTQIFVDYT